MSEEKSFNLLSWYEKAREVSAWSTLSTEPIIAPQPLDVPDTHVPALGDIYEYAGRHWRVHALADANAAFMTVVPGNYMGSVPVGYVQKYMRRIWPED